jgi:hypothetical protein
MLPAPPTSQHGNMTERCQPFSPGPTSPLVRSVTLSTAEAVTPARYFRLRPGRADQMGHLAARKF